FNLDLLIFGSISFLNKGDAFYDAISRDIPVIGWESHEPVPEGYAFNRYLQAQNEAVYTLKTSTSPTSSWKATNKALAMSSPAR
ncbi:MAG: hypothetical protein M5U34_46130, partial [Chloroflexi bacterium]|nr:hypothetical protein [Chloroflexota bacterium]